MRKIVPMLTKEIRISDSVLKTAVMVSLAVPVLLFHLLFLRWTAGVFFGAALTGAVILYIRRLFEKRGGKKNGTDARGGDFSLSVLSLLSCLLLAAAWTLLSGIGGYFTQSQDFHNRNAIFRDLLTHSWPVYFEGTNSALTYYIGYWIVPALIGKAGELLFGSQAAWSVGNSALYLQTVLFLLLTFLLLLSYCRRTRHVGRALLLFILFSGMDGLIVFLRNDWSPHIEWWGETWQYSSLTTGLFWIFNQAIPAWMVSLLFLHSVGDIWCYGLIGLICTLYSPFPLVSLAALLILHFLVTFLRSGDKRKVWKQVFSPVNLCALIGMIPVFFYLTANLGSGGDPLHLELFRDYYPTVGRYVYRLGLFWLIEWGFYALILSFRFKKDPVFWLNCLLLAVIPFFKMGVLYNDFTMRASIPGLVILSAYCIRYLSESAASQRRFLTYALVASLTIGALTPLTEIKRGIAMWRVNGGPVIEDDRGTVLNAEEDMKYFISDDTESTFFYRYLARPK